MPRPPKRTDDERREAARQWMEQHKDFTKFKGVEDDGHDYTEDELEFLKAIDRYKRANRRPFPTWREVLQVLKELGYKKDR